MSDQEGIKLETRRSEEAHRLLNGDEKNDDENYDLEARAGVVQAQNTDDSSAQKPVEYSISPQVKFAWLSTYFLCSLVLTLYNKLVLGVVRSAQSPLLLHLVESEGARISFARSRPFADAESFSSSLSLGS